MDKVTQKYIDMINDMLLDDEYSWADKTLHGILEVIKRHEYITIGQQTAIDNILKSKPYSETYKEYEE